MRGTVTESASSLLAGVGDVPGGYGEEYARSYLLRMRTATASVFLEVGSAAATGVASVATGFEWKTSDSPLSITLEPSQGIHGIVAVSGGTQVIDILASGR